MRSFLVAALIVTLASLLFTGVIDAGAFGEFLRSFPGWTRVLSVAFLIFLWLIIEPDSFR
jgi:uncharacterized membrane protein